MNIELSSDAFKVTIPIESHITIIDADSGVGKSHMVSDIVVARDLNRLKSNIDLSKLFIYSENFPGNYDYPTLFGNLTKSDYVLFDEANNALTNKMAQCIRESAATFILVYRGVAFANISVFARLLLHYDVTTGVYSFTHTLLDNML